MEISTIRERTAAPSLVEALQGRLAAHSTIVKFLIVGAFGYLIYQSALFIVYDVGLFPFLPAKGVSGGLVLFDHGDIRFLIASLVAMELGITAGFTGHHRWTFRERADGKPILLRFGQFHANQLFSALVILTVTVNVLTVEVGLYHFIAAPMGVALAGAWNWMMDSQLIWRKSKGRGTAT